MKENEVESVFLVVVRTEKALRKLSKSEEVADSERDGLKGAADHLKEIAVRMFKWNYNVLTDKV